MMHEHLESNYDEYCLQEVACLHLNSDAVVDCLVAVHCKVACHCFLLFAEFCCAL